MSMLGYTLKIVFMSVKKDVNKTFFRHFQLCTRSWHTSLSSRMYELTRCTTFSLGYERNYFLFVEKGILNHVCTGMAEKMMRWRTESGQAIEMRNSKLSHAVIKLGYFITAGIWFTARQTLYDRTCIPFHPLRIGKDRRWLFGHCAPDIL